MKRVPFFPYLMILASLASCQSGRGPCDEVVCETVHRYGVPLDPQDWSERGQNGQVVSMRKDGVTVTRSYEDGILHGDCTYTFPHCDVIQQREVYNQGTLTQAIDHYPSGLPRRQMAYESPQKQSTVVWYESGSPQARELHVNGELVQGEYYNDNHQVESRVDDSNGFKTQRDGLGRLEAVDTIENGKKILSTTFHPNRTPAAVTSYVGGAVEGERRTFLPGGEPATIEQWSGNVQHGNTTVYVQGEKRADVPYVNGVKHGVEKRYRGEAIAQEINWVKGEQHGPSYTYMGGTKQTDWYFRGKHVPNKATFDMLSTQ
jgi:antitoxin component YwqK of YwqJK toxin-antitoxin module